MKDIIVISNQPAALDVNFEAVKAHLSQELQKYDVVVTSDTLKDAKTLATELNQTRQQFEKRRKEEVAKASEPVKAFDEKMKELSKMCQDGRTKILSQVEKFEDETRAVVQKLLAELRDQLRDDANVLPEFHKAEFDDLAVVSNLTGTGKLTKKAIDTLTSRVKEEKAMQDQTRMRLVELENQSYKAGLSAPLTRDHVAHFLFTTEEAYQAELERIIGAELKRQERAEIAARQRILREQEVESQVQASQPVKQPDPVWEVKSEPVAAPAPKAEEKPAAKGTEWVAVVAEFQVQVPSSLSDEKIKATLLDQMKKAGFKSEPEVKIYRTHTEQKAGGF